MRGIVSKTKGGLLETALETLNIDIMAVQETLQTKGDDPDLKNYEWIAGNKLPDTTTSGTGLGWCVSKRVANNVEPINGENQELCQWLRVRMGNVTTLIGNIYISPSTNAFKTALRHIEKEWKAPCREEPTHRTVLMGDFNAWLGQGNEDDVIGPLTSDPKSQKEDGKGKKLREWLIENNLHCLNGRTEDSSQPATQHTRKATLSTS